MTDPEMIKSLKRRLETHRRHLYTALDQLSIHGRANAPKGLIETIREDRAGIRYCRDALLRCGEDIPGEPDDTDLSDTDLDEDPVQRLHQALLSLNYHRQERAVRNWLHTRAIGAFIIHGPSEDYGQYWLLNRLIKNHLPLSTTAKAITVDLRCALRSSDPQALWRELGRQVRLPHGAAPQQIAQQVYQLWTTQSVVLIFKNIGYLSLDLFELLIGQFWEPLVCAVQAKPAGRFRLLLFLIDTSGKAAAWLPAQPPADTHRPLCLEALTCFSEYDLRSWFEQHGEKLLPEPCDDPELLVQGLLKQSYDGLPEVTLAELCCLYNIELDIKDRLWMRYR